MADKSTTAEPKTAQRELASFLDIPKEFLDMLETDNVTTEEKPDPALEAMPPEPEEAEPESEEQIEAEGDEPEQPEAEKEEDEEEKEPEENMVPQSRVDKLTAQKYALQEQLEEAQKQLADTKAKLEEQPFRTQSTINNPLSNVNTEEELDKTVKMQRAVKAWALRHWDGFDSDGNPAVLPDAKGNPQEISMAKVREYYANAEEILSDLVPERRQFIAQKKQYDDMAHNMFPDYFNRDTPRGQEHMQHRKDFKHVLSHPQGEMMLALMALGYDVVRNSQKNNGKKNEAKKPEVAPPTPVSRSSTPTRKEMTPKDRKAEILKKMASSTDASRNMDLVAEYFS